MSSHLKKLPRYFATIHCVINFQLKISHKGKLGTYCKLCWFSFQLLCISDMLTQRRLELNQDASS